MQISLLVIAISKTNLLVSQTQELSDMYKRNKSCRNLFTEGKRPIKWHFIDVHKNKNLVRHNISFLLSINNEHLKQKCKRCFILKKKKRPRKQMYKRIFQMKRKMYVSTENASLSFSASTSQSVILLQQLRSCEEIFKTYPIYIQIQQCIYVYI